MLRKWAAGKEEKLWTWPLRKEKRNSTEKTENLIRKSVSELPVLQNDIGYKYERNGLLRFLFPACDLNNHERFL